jgi:hypothetical protein
VRNRLLLLLAGALTALALALPAASSAAECPKGQTGTPPYCAPLPPSNKFNLGKVKHPSTGVVTIRVRVSSGGTFTATAPLMKTAKATGKTGGTFTLKLKLNAKGMAALAEAKGRQLRIKVKFTFAPTGGEPRTKLKKLIFRVVRP